jgi:hypothetical protein
MSFGGGTLVQRVRQNRIKRLMHGRMMTTMTLNSPKTASLDHPELLGESSSTDVRSDSVDFLSKHYSVMICPTYGSLLLRCRKDCKASACLS